MVSYKIDDYKKLITHPLPPLDIVAYDRKINELANNPVFIGPRKIPNLWPVETVYPKAGAILPFKRIVAYYGNLYSKQMGVFGAISGRRNVAKARWRGEKMGNSDPDTPVLPALHTSRWWRREAQAKMASTERMPDSEIDKVLAMATKIDAMVFGSASRVFNVQTEIPLLEKYLKMPQVYLGIDPEFSMKSKIE